MKFTKHLSLMTIIRVTISIAVIVLVIFQAAQYLQIRQTLKKIEEKNIEIVIEENIPTITSLYYFHFDEELEKTLRNIEHNIASIKKMEIVKKPVALKKNQMLYPLHYKNRTVGYLLVDYDYDLVHSFFKKYNFYFIFFILTLLLLAGMFAFYINRKIGALYKFSTKLNEIDIQKTKHVTPTDHYLEIEVIAAAINNLLRTIRLYIHKIKQNELHLQQAQKIANMSSWEYMKEMNSFFCSSQLYRMLGINMKERLTWETFVNMIDPADRALFVKKIEEAYEIGSKFEIVVKIHTYQGEKYLKNVVKVKKKRNSSPVVIGIAIDVTEEMRAKEQVEFLAFHDPLTSLPNRASFQDFLENFPKIAKRSGERFALIFLDIDNFKFVNDTYGHDTGDKLLIKIAQTLQKTLRASDLVFRIGGDEFVILIPNIQSKESLNNVMEKIKNSIAKEYRFGNISFTVSCSLGIAIYPDDSNDMETLTRFADIAMYEAKKSGKNRYIFFKEEMKQFLDHQHQTSQDLQTALKKDDELLLFFQPKIDIREKRVIGAEALIRWNHPEKGLLAPNFFIPVAENSSLIEKVDEYVITKSFRYLQEWSRDSHLKEMVLSLNVSARQFKNPRFVEFLQNNLEKYRIDPSKLEIEITETLSMENISYTIQMLESIKEIGFQVALDDFGTGYSSLNYLKKLPFDTIKIDRSFIQDIDKDPEDYQITKIIVDIARTFQKKVIAEGVETREQERILRELQCFHIQGYLYAKPLPLEEFIRFSSDFANRLLA